MTAGLTEKAEFGITEFRYVQTIITGIITDDFKYIYDVCLVRASEVQGNGIVDSYSCKLGDSSFGVLFSGPGKQDRA